MRIAPELKDRSRDLRTGMTDAERALWRRLRLDQLGVRFRRQHPIGPFIADFACVAAKLVIECDGGQHDDSPRDPERDRFIAARGWRVLRVWNNEVLGNIEGVVETIIGALRPASPHPDPPPPKAREGAEQPLPTSGPKPSPGSAGEGWVGASGVPNARAIDPMRTALRLAQRGLGRTWPNPAVGCVILAPDGATIARGWTQPGGRPHAEVHALAQAGAAAKGATVYITLEPCAHHGRTPPCAEALITAGVARVIVACPDPDPRVDGRGIALLRAAGVAVIENVLREEAEYLNAGFLKRVRLGLPLVTLKLATGLDGRIAAASGDSRWITGAAARQAAHRLRATHDAVLVGTGTALADDPLLTVRIDGLGDRRPVRVVLDRTGRLPGSAKMLHDQTGGPVWIVTSPKRAPVPGAEIVPVGEPNAPALDPTLVLRALAARGLTRVLVEGGGRLAASLVQAGLVDRLVWFRAAALHGGDALPGIGPLGLSRVAEAPRFRLTETRRLGDDVMEMYDAAP